MSSRSLPVPDGLDNERVDAGLSRLLGISRTKSAELAVAGDVLLDGKKVGKSDRLVAGAWLEVTLADEEEYVADIDKTLICLKVSESAHLLSTCECVLFH